MLGCGEDSPAPPTAWTVTLAPGAPRAMKWAADDLVDYLGAMGEEASLARAEATGDCDPAALRVLLVDEPPTELGGEPLTDQTFSIDVRHCGAGRLVTLSGGGLLGRQYAVYEWLHALGVRFFHPEEELVPERPGFASQPWRRVKTPDIEWRSVSLHLTHPLELGDPIRLADERYAAEVDRYVDWQIKNLASFGTLGANDRGRIRGLPRSGGFSLHNEQQGGRPLIDPDDPDWRSQVAAAIDAQMAADDPPTHFGFTFNPSEFTEIDDQQAVEELTFIADYFAERHPEVDLYATNHATPGEPTEHYGVRYYDLPQFAPPNLGVKVHPVMFYDLFGPAPVYGAEDFGSLLDFIEQEAPKRRIWHFPESAWWLTFDIAVPLYLPITLKARDNDIQGLRHLVAEPGARTGLVGHRTFGSGHEWGYWQNEYCSLRMAADTEYRWTDCLADLSPCAPDLLADFVAAEEAVFLDAEVLAWLVGTDPETEVAASIGVVFHPLPPAPSAIMGWDEARLDTWERELRPALEAFAEWSDFEIDEGLCGGGPWLDEIRDGVVATGLRARHAAEVYGAVVEKRRGRDADARALLQKARETTEAVREIVLRREAAYRYQPLDRSIAGGPDGTEDENWTIYPYRYLNRTHHLYYYTRIDALAAEVVEGASEALRIADALLGPGEPLVLEVTDRALAEVEADFGDGGGASTYAGPRVEHAFAAPGVYTVRARSPDGSAELSVEVAALSEVWSTGFAGEVVEPAGAAIIEAVLPALVVGPAGAAAALGFATTDDGAVRPGLWKSAPLVEGDAPFAAGPATLEVPVVNRTTGEVRTTIRVDGATVRLDDPAGPLKVGGTLSTGNLVAAVVQVGGFEPQGARNTIAALLGYTPETLPAELPFALEYRLE